MKNFKSWLLAGVVLFSSPAFASQVEAPEAIPGAGIVTAEQVIELLGESSTILVDTRLTPVHKKGHIEGSLSISDMSLSYEVLSALTGGDKSRALIFYCDGPRCLRSGRAAAKAIGYGFSRVYWMRGGWAEWVAKGLPVVKQGIR
jgi:rhodanese-related sulfurtransferase